MGFEQENDGFPDMPLRSPDVVWRQTAGGRGRGRRVGEAGAITHVRDDSSLEVKRTGLVLGLKLS